MNSVKYVGMDVHKGIPVFVVLNAAGYVESRTQVKTKAENFRDFFRGLSGRVEVHSRTVAGLSEISATGLQSQTSSALNLELNHTSTPSISLSVHCFTKLSSGARDDIRLPDGRQAVRDHGTSLLGCVPPV